MTKTIYVIRQNDMILKAFSTRSQAMNSMHSYQSEWRKRHPEDDSISSGFNMIEVQYYEQI